MHVNEYLAGFTYKDPPPRGSAATAAVWSDAGTLPLAGKHLRFGDAVSLLYDPLDVALPAGSYVLHAECVAYGSDCRIARLRGLLPGAVETARRCAERFSVDVGTAGLIDADAMDAWAGGDEAGYESWCDEFEDARLDAADPVGFHPCPDAGVDMLYLETGFGDGTYEVFVLTGPDGRPVGFEAVFIKPGQGYFEP